MRVGIIEILALPSQRWTDTIYHSFLTKQFASVTPQAISVWCRQLGHETFYAIYYGVGDAHHRLPPDLDIIFIACYTQTSPIAYALAKLYRKAGTRTVIGGPHAKSFPVDCLRFFDLVVKECDKDLIVDILAGHFDPGTFIGSAKPFDDLPTVEERMPEIRASAFFQGKWPVYDTTVPMLASMGCPHTCDFCTDWDNPYRLLSTDRLAEDLRYLTKNLPGTLIGFHDPNFGIKFDPVFDTLEAVPPSLRVPYVMECSLSTLRKSRLKRLKETNCVCTLHGVESWMDYSGKAGVGQKRGLEKVEQVVEHFQLLSEYVPYIQACFIFGLDTDMGDDPITLTKNFMDHTPFVWPSLNIPIPLGGTPLYQQHLGNGRILKTMPFGFYFMP
ncbi:MAG TPA: radical SAM protein, partial [Thioploca sp.]|nr:radical SAM protein [Thioploca sp.]